ncbi:olfactory receptor 14J1-like [Carettochelys insculpta]|uniref:olfactory receptor 14J1-like n=1 Tax=Carettochelys insculpta TaxID=44489 RepID=UPI003EB825E5
MSNGTSVTEFLLLAFPEVRELQILYFVGFLAAYLAALVGNLLIMSAITLDRRLHTPMYFFLANLSLLDLGSISVIVLKSMANALTNTRRISYHSCMGQVFFFLLFATTELPLLTVMAYDRYVAICRPLNYTRVMNSRACAQMAAGTWLSGVLNSALHTGNTFAIIFCGDNELGQFFCEIPQLLRLACYDSYLGETGAIVVSVCFALTCFAFIIVSYVLIFRTVLGIPSEHGRRKAFSTCLPHLAVVSLFVCTASIAYIKPTSSSGSELDLVVAVLYSVVPPMMNPIIYSMRNKDIKAALRKMFGPRLFSS